MRVRKKYERMNNVRVEERNKGGNRKDYNWNMSLCRNVNGKEEEIGSGKGRTRSKGGKGGRGGKKLIKRYIKAHE